MSRYYWMVLWLLAALLIGGCGGDTERADSGATAEQEPVVEGNTALLDELAQRGDGLLYIQGRALYRYSFAAGEAELLVDDVPDGAKIVPQANAAVFLPTDGSQLLYTNLTTGVQTVIHDFEQYFTRAWGVISTSPDGEWLLVSAANQGYMVRHDGTVIPFVEGYPYSANWLVEPAGFILSHDPQGDGYFVGVFDTTTETYLPMDAGPILGGTREELSRALEAVGYTLPAPDPNAPRPFYVNVPDEITMNQAMLPCGTWSIETADGPSDINVFYSADDVFELTDVVRRDDGSLLFVQAVAEDCRPSMPTGTLLLHTDDHTVTLGEGVFVGLQMGRQFGRYFGSVPITNHLAVSPDGEWVAWLQGSLDAAESSLMITRLDDAAYPTTALLTVDGARLISTDFVEQGLFYEVFWVE